MEIRNSPRQGGAEIKKLEIGKKFVSLLRADRNRHSDESIVLMIRQLADRIIPLVLTMILNQVQNDANCGCHS